MSNAQILNSVPSYRSPLALSAMHPAFTPVNGPAGGQWKRFFDIVMSLTALIVLAPVMLIIAALVFAFIGRPVLHMQTCVGFKGQTFRRYRFRTAAQDSAGDARTVAKDGDCFHAYMTGQRERLTLFGSMLRQSGLDELPQLLNVLLGHMSCVGPRPITPGQVVRYGRHAGEYVKVRPGLTGLWSVYTTAPADYTRRITLDRIYVRSLSPRADLSILLKAVLASLRASNGVRD